MKPPPRFYYIKKESDFMAFTAGYKVNEGTQYEFTVSNETIQEMV